MEALDVILTVVLVALDDVPQFVGVDQMLNCRVPMSMAMGPWPLVAPTVLTLGLSFRGWLPG